MTSRVVSALVLAIVALSGCAAGRGTYFIADAQKHVRAAEASGAPETAVYAWTMADEYMRKSWEEWGNSDYEDAENLAKKAAEWADKAEQIARSGGGTPMLDDAPVEAP